jgi:hypothetical protein
MPMAAITAISDLAEMNLVGLPSVALARISSRISTSPSTGVYLDKGVSANAPDEAGCLFRSRATAGSRVTVANSTTPQRSSHF